MKEVTQQLEFWVGSTMTRVLASHLTIFNALLVAVLITVHSFFSNDGNVLQDPLHCISNSGWLGFAFNLVKNNPLHMMIT
jgi:hypothetical protein